MNFSALCYNFVYAVNSYLALPSIVLFLGTAIILTLKNKVPQIIAFPRFVQLITQGIKKDKDSDVKTIGPFQALFTAMATTIGMGNIVGPSMAISVGGPGALFWLVFYIFFGSAIKFTEVTFSVYARTASTKGDILGGPTQYLRLVSPILGIWYAALTVLLFTVWSSIQVNTISCICAIEGVPHWLSGLVTVSVLLVVVLGGVQRIGYVASKLVPFMFLFYLFFASLILIYNFNLLGDAIGLVFRSAFNQDATIGGLIGITAFTAMREGIYKSIFITESGIGTSSIAHALSDAKNPIDQGVLAMFSGIADILLCILSGLLTIVTGIWMTGKLSNTLIYEVFKMYSPVPGGPIILIISIFLFVMTTLIGNTFNGSQSFASFTNYKYVKAYYTVAAIIAFFGSILTVPLLWNLMDIILALVAVPNLIGIIILSFKYSSVLKLKKLSK